MLGFVKFTYLLQDKAKQMECKDRNIVLVEVPYWWDQREESLYQLITNSHAERSKETTQLPYNLSMLEIVNSTDKYRGS